MDYQKDDKQLTINNEFDYSNALIETDTVLFLVKYCDQLYNNFLKIVKMDEERNQRLKHDLQNFEYKKSFSSLFEVSFKEKGHDRVTCKSYQDVINMNLNGYLRNVEYLIIMLNLSYRKGTNSNLEDYSNVFKISFNPYKITFLRNSNHDEDNMRGIENSINEIFRKVSTINTIFCTK